MKKFDNCLEGTNGPIILGIIIGILAAIVQGLTISAGGPEAYGFCALCHTRDLVNGLLNIGLGTNLGLAAVSKAAILPVMSMVGVLIGGFIAAKVSKEFRVKSASIKDVILYFIGGVLLMQFGLLLGACPYRAAIRFAYGDLVALVGIIGIVVGVWISLILIQRSSKGGL
ncbi:MAG TPA: YeeE/YedE thiosulfate transporter family protein [Methanospirillum sp.]|uniref:YeeE/YedE thiosulfate transporter family protein n=1 Tax=Methanospirillum sp. TaxID=45200 RepID=UPI002B83A890|nr:YeeE/YedE thiosulfate transporter family protein [Methanospirillum sp.]HWQ63087.1 YeeE/YedE thiosulfate transporter family protein [Methanospirillum sp.]